MGTAAEAQVYLRGEKSALAADVVGADATGVTVKVGEEQKIIGWDRVREVRGEKQEAASPHLANAEHLWRARTRLERGDFGGAEAIIESLRERYAGATGPTAAVVHESALRCAMHRGALSGAMWAWLDWRRAVVGRSAAWVGGKVGGASFTDARTGLVITMPPVFLAEPSVEVAAASPRWEEIGKATGESGADAATAALARVYHAALKFELGEAVALTVESEDEGVRLAGDVVLARVGTDEQRAAARAALQRRIGTGDAEAWVECWARLGLGRSLVRESDAGMKRQGLLHLLHVPARFSRLSSHMASMALAEAAVTCHELGDEQGADALKGELLSRFPSMPSTGWSKLREIRRRSGAEAKPTAQAEQKEGSQG